MTYIGQQPSTTFDSGIQDRFTGLTTNTVTLTHDISAETDILVVWNNIVQDSGSYSVGGAGNKTLTLGGTLVSADVVTVYYTNKVMQSISPTAGSVQTLSINDGAVTNAKLANSSITLNGSAVSLGGSATIDNSPMWVATMSADQTGGNNDMVKINYNTEVLDTDSAYDTSSYRFTVPSGKQGKYFISALTNIHSSGSNPARSQTNSIYVNGSSIVRSQLFSASGAGSIFEKDQDNICHCTLLHDLSVGDYVEVYAKRYSDHSENIKAKTSWSRFMGFKLA